jgi:hypothetical protein
LRMLLRDPSRMDFRPAAAAAIKPIPATELGPLGGRTLGRVLFRSSHATGCYCRAMREREIIKTKFPKCSSFGGALHRGGEESIEFNINPRTVQIGRFRTPAMRREGGRKRAHCMWLAVSRVSGRKGRRPVRGPPKSGWRGGWRIRVERVERVVAMMMLGGRPVTGRRRGW